MSDNKLQDSKMKAITHFKEYLRIPSVHPDVNYDGCVDFLKKCAMEIGLKFNVFELSPKKPVVILSWFGSQPNLPSLILNSHMDVVPVFPFLKTFPGGLVQTPLISLKSEIRDIQDLNSYLRQESVKFHSVFYCKMKPPVVCEAEIKTEQLTQSDPDDKQTESVESDP